MNFKVGPFTILCAIFIIGSAVEMKYFYRIGSRISGDRLIFTDTLHSPLVSKVPINHTISFRYPVTMLITSIDLYSDANVLAEFVLSYDNILHGVVTAANALEFELTIEAYGLDFKEAPENFNSPLTPKTKYSGKLIWEKRTHGDEETFDLDMYDYDMDDSDVGMEIISIGDRQPGDRLLYTDFKSSDTTEHPSKHEVVFRFIDSYFLTHAQFRSFDNQNATAIFSHVSENSLKAVVEVFNSTSLDVELKIYGYDSDEKPTTYYPLLPSIKSSRFQKQILCDGQSSVTITNFLIVLSIAYYFSRL